MSEKTCDVLMSFQQKEDQKQDVSKIRAITLMENVK